MARKADRVDISQYMTHGEAADLLGISLSNVYAAVKRGALQTAEILGKTVLVRSSVEAYRPRRYPRPVRKGEPT